MGYAEVEHTADVAIRVWGRSLAELFQSAGEAVFAPVTDARGPAVERRLAIASGDCESLLVDWLSELLYLGEVNQEAYQCFAVAVEPGWRLRATIRGRGLGADRPRAKAATYHGLSIVQTDGMYTATVVLDT